MKRIIFLASLFLFAHTFALAQTRKDGDKPDLNRGRTLYTVGYVHLDTQWNWDYTKTIDVFLKRTLERNFDLFEKYPDYIFTTPTSTPRCSATCARGGGSPEAPASRRAR